MRLYTIILLFVVIQAHQTSAQCSDPGGITWENTWESCEAVMNPNSQHGTSHWILYDLGALYKLTTAHIWNTNESGKTDRGFRNVTVDYSANGSDWTELGTYEFPEGTGAHQYGGFEGFNFRDRCVRFILITAHDNWGHSDCFGLAEVKFNINTDYGGDCDAITVNVHSVTDEQAGIELFPNPTADWLYVNMEGIEGEVEMRIITPEGREMLRRETSAGSSSNMIFPVYDLPPGSYFLIIRTESSSYTRRFITVR